MSRPIPITADAAGSFLIEVLAKVPAGFPSPAQDHTQQRIDLNDVLVLNPIATFLFQVEGDSMIDARIFDGDRLIVDRSIEPMHGRVVLACVDDEFTVKRLYKRSGVVRLHAANPHYPPITFVEGQEMLRCVNSASGCSNSANVGHLGDFLRLSEVDAPRSGKMCRCYQGRARCVAGVS